MSVQRQKLFLGPPYRAHSLAAKHRVVRRVNFLDEVMQDSTFDGAGDIDAFRPPVRQQPAHRG